MTPVRILELRSVRGTGGGPEKTILLGAARTDPSRYAVTVCYLRDRRDDVFGIDAKARELGVDYEEVIERHSWDPSVVRKLRQIIRQRAIDIVHAHEYKTNLIAWWLSMRERVVALSTVHGWTGHSARERFVYYPADKHLLRLFPQLIAVSGEIRNELVRSGVQSRRIATVLNGIDHRAFRRDRARETEIRRDLGIRPDSVVVGTVGRLEPQKRFDLLLDACATLRTRRPNLVLLVAGDGSLRESLTRQADARGFGSACRFLGHRTDVATLHHAFDVFVQSSDYEGTPNAVLEAMALETPVVATSVGGTPELLRDGVDGLLVPSSNVQALGRAIDTTLTDRSSMTARVRAARRRVETELSFDARMAAVEAVYSTLAPTRAESGNGVPEAVRT